VRFAESGHQVNQVAGQRRVDALAQRWQDREFVPLDDP
jgi:hypothetical protein